MGIIGDVISALGEVGGGVVLFALDALSVLFAFAGGVVCCPLLYIPLSISHP